jgi:hypothetical protein
MQKSMEGGTMHDWPDLTSERIQQKIINEMIYREWRNNLIVKWISIFRQFL